ncbi:hypothetical protein DICA0_D00562 [Diutina catenulata]
MKFSTTTLLALAAASVAQGSAIPMAQAQVDVPAVIKSLEGLRDALGARDLNAMSHDELNEFAKRDLGDALSQLISAFSNSGILGDIWNTISTNDDLKNQVFGLVKSIFSSVVGALPNLISAIWNSGLLQNIFKKLTEDGELQSAIWNLVKEGFNTILGMLTGGNNQAKRELESIYDTHMEMMGKRDLGEIVSSLFQSVVSWIQANPDTIKNILNSVVGLIGKVLPQILNWLTTSGVFEQILNAIAGLFKNSGANTGEAAAAIAAVGQSLGANSQAAAALDKIADAVSSGAATAAKATGSVDLSDILADAKATGDVKPTGTGAATKPTGTGNVADQLDALLGGSSPKATAAPKESPKATAAASTAPVAAAAGAAPKATAAPASSDDSDAAGIADDHAGGNAGGDDVYNSLLAAYGGKQRRARMYY